MKLSELLKSVPGARMLSGGAEADIQDISIDSRKVRGGTLFMAVSGSKQDGHLFISDAVSRKASAVAVTNPGFACADAPSVLIPDMRQALPLLSACLFGAPSSRMDLVGITGTNGKTTTAFLVRSILESAGMPCGLSGTVEYCIGGRRIPASLTTPEINDMSRMLRDMLEAGQKHCVMEVSSQALCAGRADGLSFRAGIFTNLTQDHLDFHADMENYYLAKRKLFDLLAARRDSFAVINVDDPFGRRLAGEVSVPVVTYAQRGPADVCAEEVESLPGLTRVSVKTASGAFALTSPLTGDFNVSNILAACACCIGFGVRPEAMARGIKALGRVDGRMEAVAFEGGPRVVVDYAHTPDALRVVLEALRRFGMRRVITVFGCGGERDRTKRPVMGRIVSELSDVSVVTNDNPRDEDPDAIIADILAGIDDPQHFRVEKDRRRAIELALSLAGPEDIVLVAGKGHESYQVVGKRVLYFNDRQVCEEIIAQKSALRPVPDK